MLDAAYNVLVSFINSLDSVIIWNNPILDSYIDVSLLELLEIIFGISVGANLLSVILGFRKDELG